MSQEVEMDPFVKQILQLGIVTKDVKAMAKRYEEEYGIGPWMIMDGEKGFDPDQTAVGLTVRGERVDFEISLASAWVGDVELELIQPLDDKGDYARFLKEHGEGVHHISIGTDPKAFAEKMKEKGIPELMKGTIPNNSDWVYYDSESELGMIAEVVDRF